MDIVLQNDFYIVRHGKAKNNELDIESCKMETQEAYGLVPEGEEKVKEEAQRYTDFELIFSSPFRRTKETAFFFAETSACEVILDERLVDVDLGDLDLSSCEVSKIHKKQHPENDYVYPNGESLTQVLDRLISFLKEVNSNYKNKKILIVSHGLPCEALLDWVAGKPLKKWDECIEKGRIFPLKT